jgi:acetyl esterase/lipase
VKKGQPPTLVLHGEDDPTVKFWTAKVFVEKMVKLGNHAELAAYPGETHGFFNFGRGSDKMFIATMQRTDEFLAKLGWLKGKPMIEGFISGAKGQ